MWSNFGIILPFPTIYSMFFAFLAFLLSKLSILNNLTDATTITIQIEKQKIWPYLQIDCTIQPNYYYDLTINTHKKCQKSWLLNTKFSFTYFLLLHIHPHIYDIIFIDLGSGFGLL